MPGWLWPDASGRSSVLSVGTLKPVARVGISGWRYAPWRGTFYPKDLPQKRELARSAGATHVLQPGQADAIAGDQRIDEHLVPVPR